MAERYRYAAFISYSSKDAAFARRLHRALEGYGIPASLGEFDLVGGGKRNRIYPVFRDREELRAGQLGDQIEANLRASVSLIVICSPSGAASPWVQREIEYFAGLGRHTKIFAVIPDNAPVVDENGVDATQSCFPPAFRGDALAGDRLEPLAADARKGKDGFRNAWLKIVAGMIGVSPGQIIDRDRRLRRQRAFRAIAVWAFALLGVGYAYAQRATLEPLFFSWTKYRPYASSRDTLTSLSPGTQFQDCRIGSRDCPIMVIIPAGTFLMGGERLTFDEEEGPQLWPEAPRRISVVRFAVSRTEITFADWQACATRGGCRGAAEPADEGWGRGNQPVINVTWDDAQDYARWLSQMTGREYRLLTEAEWEYAARGITTTDVPSGGEGYSFGNDLRRLGDYAWYSGNSDQRTHQVGTKRANQFGLYDIYGNVQEWVEDCFVEYDPQRLTSAAVETDTGGENACLLRVLRGGSWSDNAWGLRSAVRERGQHDARHYGVGFRVARTL